VRRIGGALVLLALLAAACGADEDAAAPAAPVERRDGTACEAPAGHAESSITTGGAERTFLQDVPDDATSGAPLVIALHGYGASGAMFHLGTGILETAHEHGFVLLAPDALPGDDDHPSWNLSPASADVRFIEDLVDHAIAALCVDPDRVHVTGHSQGGFLISTLACTSAERITSVATVAGLRAAPGGCTPADSVPLLAFHDRGDRIVPYDGGLPRDLARRLHLPAGGPSIPELVEAWTARHPGVTVELRTTDGRGHGWPPEANEEIWAFFDGGA
jgi:polyhydroxybutyrate depolymerase